MAKNVLERGTILISEIQLFIPTLPGRMDSVELFDNCDEEREITIAILPINPIVEKDKDNYTKSENDFERCKG